MALLEGKDVLVGVIDVASETAETPDQVAATITLARRVVADEHLIASTNCGMAPMAWDTALAKLEVIRRGAILAG
jgi:5-methyltetrahydropteroyltriglutamate--homocysteine methyltransferase